MTPRPMSSSRPLSDFCVDSPAPADAAGPEMRQLLTEIRACTVCASHLPGSPRPILQAGNTSRIVIIGQAPGRRVHESGVPWDDASGQRLRQWLGISRQQFYDPGLVALIPMGFCYPGSTRSGDKPPRPECAPLWHARILDRLSNDRLEVIIGTYAQARYIPDRAATLTATVANWVDYLPAQIVLPHPSPRNGHWLTKNPWFEKETLPAVRKRVLQVIDKHQRRRN